MDVYDGFGADPAGGIGQPNGDRYVTGLGGAAADHKWATVSVKRLKLTAYRVQCADRVFCGEGHRIALRKITVRPAVENIHGFLGGAGGENDIGLVDVNVQILADDIDGEGLFIDESAGVRVIHGKGRVVCAAGGGVGGENDRP